MRSARSWSARGRIARNGAAFALLGALLALLVAATCHGRLERADFVFNNAAEITTLDPAAVSGIPEGRVMVALYEGLTVRDPKTSEPLPGVAENWEISRDGKTYVFHLRADARWSNGERVSAQDFEWSWRRLLTPETAAPYAYLLRCVRGARAYSREPVDRLWAEVGIRAEDVRTLAVELESPTPYFLHLTSFHALFPVHRPTLERARERSPETWQVEWVRPENIVTNGPFVISERRINDRMRLVKNPFYWDERSVAMRTIDVLAVEGLNTMLNLYLCGEVDWIDRVPTTLIPRLLPREDFDPVPYLATYFYRVNVTRPTLADARVRRALGLAIDRRAICRKITKKGESPSFSLTPLGLTDYPRPEMEHAPRESDDSNQSEAFELDCARAADLLSSAGFGPRGRPFPPIEIHYNTSEAHRDIAEVIADGWRRYLGIDARLLNQEWKVYLDTQTTLGFDVSRSSWIGDYADPNTFVELFVTGGENNRTGWSNPRYDALVRDAARELDPARRLELLASAETILLDELPVLPIYSYVTQNLVHPGLGGFFENPRDDHFPKFWYWKADAPGEPEEEGARSR